MSVTRPKLCGRRQELWSWSYGDLDDYCAERYEIPVAVITPLQSPIVHLSSVLSDSLCLSLSRRLLSCPLWSPSCWTLKSLCLPWSKKTSARSWTASRSTSLGRSTWIKRSDFRCGVKIWRGTLWATLFTFILSWQRNFYGPQERWMFLSMFLRVGVWRNLWRAYRRGFGGNLRGEGLVLGGVFVIGPGDQVGSSD